MTEPVEVTIDYDENGIRMSRYPWWILRNEGDRLVIRGRLLEVKRVQTAASLYAKRHGIRLATRDASVNTGNGLAPALSVFHQGKVRSPS